MEIEATEKTKKFRDPIYGYIEIEESTVHNIIDTATFQRLRNVRQTSYEPLYPSSLHNRFVHSLGVYYLGCMAFKAILRSLQINEERKKRVLGKLKGLFKEGIVRYEALFKIACLLHDVGHAPFSHTGEEFYLNSKSQAEFISSELIEQKQEKIAEITDEEEKKKLSEELEEMKRYSIFKHLAYLTKDSVFTESVAHEAASHEIMSCIVALEAFGEDERYFKNYEERSFFARCITGIQYENAQNLKQEDYMKMKEADADKIYKKMLLNCIIQLLHSSVIDVDRLDYIIRDASTMGYQSVSIDYERLLSGLEIVLIDDYNFTIGFHKNAVSVIENAVYAHDNEKKWIQSHPAILYDSFLLQQAISYIEDKIKSEYPDAQATLFSYDSLTGEGVRFAASGKDNNKIHIRYLGDADLIYLMKNRYNSEYAEEYFSRNTRRLPIWKSEAEFRHLFNESERKTINNALEKIMTDDSGKVDSIEIKEEIPKMIRADIEVSKQNGYSNRADVYEKKLKYVDKLLELCEKYNIKKNIVLLSKSFFKSNFSKEIMQNLPILFPEGESPSKFEEVSTTLQSEKTDDEKLVYLFYYPGENRKKVDVCGFAKELLTVCSSVK